MFTRNHELIFDNSMTKKNLNLNIQDFVDKVIHVKVYCLENIINIFNKIKIIMDILRKHVVEFPLYKNDIIAYVCEYLCDEKFFYYKSIENYLIKKEPTFNRKLYYHFYNMVFLSLLLKYLLFITNPNENIKIQFGEFIFILMPTEYEIAYIFIVLISLCASVSKMILFYSEINYKLKVLKFSRNLSEESPFYSLKNNKQNSLNLIINVLFWMIRLLAMLSGINLFVILLIMTLYIYLYLEYDFSIFILLISVIHIYLFYKHWAIMTLGGVVLISIVIMFLIWKLNEIIKSIRLSVLWRNKVKLFDNMITYNKYTKLVHEISGPINYTICFIFLITPPLLSTTIILWKRQANTLIEKSFHICVLIYIPSQIIFIYTFNHFCASIPLRNRSIAKYLYPVFYDKNFHRIQMHRSLRFYSYRTQKSNLLIHMKIDSFIARLNKQFLGFYCFNLFQFTKLAMLQYLSYFSTVYILFNKLIK